MAFNYQSAGPAGQTPLSPTAKDIQCKSFKVDLSVANATTAVAYDLGWLPKDAQIVNAGLVSAVATSGPSVTNATAVISVAGIGNIMSGATLFTVGHSQLSATSYFLSAYATPPTADQKLQYTITLTGGATATAGVFYVNIFYVI